MSPSAIIEGFAIETKDGLIFSVKGRVHPPDRIIAYLRYAPDREGGRERGGRRYRRVYAFEEQQAILRHYPVYWWDDPQLGLRLQSVPRHLVETVYDPCEYLALLRQQGPSDELEAHALALMERIRDEAGVAEGGLGISGSLLIGTHRLDSDIDLVVYGEAASRRIHRTLGRLLDDQTVPLRRPTREEMVALHAGHAPDTPLSFQTFARHQARKVNEFRFRGRECFARFVKRAGETDAGYDAYRFEQAGQATLTARVTDDSEAIFTPCRYGVTDVTVLQGAPVEGLHEIVSFRGRFSDQVREGERATARGLVERVIPKDGAPYSRIVVGGTSGDILVASDEN